jgi:hypothetical protein
MSAPGGQLREVTDTLTYCAFPEEHWQLLVPVRRNDFNAVPPELVIERIAVVGAITDQVLRLDRAL